MHIPKKSTLFESITRDVDERGSILSIVDNEIKNVSIIECKKGVIRSNHYHKKDYHFMYVLDGEIDYFFGDIDCELDDLKYIKVNSSKCIYTPNREFHVTYFPKRTEILVFNGQARDQNIYEDDLVRRDLVKNENIHSLLSKFNAKRSV